MHLRFGRVFGVLASAALAGVGAMAESATLAPLTTFGGGDGWRAPGEVLPGDTPGTDTSGYYNYLNDQDSPLPFSAGNVERGLAYNPTTGNLILVSRSSAGNGIRILDGQTGVDLGGLNQGSGIIGGGNIFAINMVAVADDGAIYVGNLSSSDFKIYRWASETASEPTLAYSGAPLAGARLGDTFDAIGSGASTRLVAGYSNFSATSGSNSFALFTTTDGVNFSGSHVSVPEDPPAVGDFGLGITFTDSDTVIGKRVENARVVDIAADGTSGTLVNSFDTDGSTLRPMDFATVAGRPLLAIAEASGVDNDPIARARIFIYDISDLSLPLAERKILEGSNLPEGAIQKANINGTGQVKFGAINGNVATIYSLVTNNGIQAYQLTLDPVAGDNADFNGDGAVDGSDFLIWQRNVGTGGTLAEGDANNDGIVTAADLDVWKTQFGGASGATAVSTVPEPAAGLLLTAAGVVGLARRGGPSRKRSIT